MLFLVDLPQRLDSGASPTFAAITGLNGQTITGDANGAWTAACNGTNQNFTITPSGTGKIVINGNVLFGIITDSGNGRIQMPNHTDKTGGYGIGADVSLHRVATTQVGFTSSSTTLYVDLRESGGATSRWQSEAGVVTLKSFASLILGSNNAPTLTLDVSNNATFAGTIKPRLATTAGAPAYVKGAIYFDTTLNKLRVGGASAWETITSA